MELSRAMETIRNHNDMVRRAGRGMAARLAAMEEARLRAGCDRLDELARAACEMLPPRHRPWRAAIVFICDALDERTGLLPASPAALAGEIREAFGFAIEATELERCRQWLMRRGPTPGLASRHAHEYRRMLLDMLAEGGPETRPDARLDRFLAAPESAARLDALRRLAGRLAERPPRRAVIGVATVAGAGVDARKAEAAALARLYNLLPMAPLGW